MARRPTHEFRDRGTGNPRGRTPLIGSVALCHLLLLASLSDALAQGVRPQAPEAERSDFRLDREDLRIDLAAAEPQVISPVAMAWDADGFLYVAEMIDYPIAPPAGRIRRLEDRDGDGLYERATIFAESLPFPNGALPCFDGVLVTAAPDILFFRDDDGDGRAEVRRVVLTGFRTGNTQLRVNGLFRGLGNWIYAANGRSDGEVRAPEWPPQKAVSISRRDLRFRFRPETKTVEEAGSIPSVPFSPGSTASRSTTSMRPAGRRSCAATGFPRIFAVMRSCASPCRTWCTTARSIRRTARSGRGGSSPSGSSWHPSTRPFDR